MVNQFKGSKTRRRNSPAAMGWYSAIAERKAMAMALVDRAMRAAELGEEVTAPAQDEEFVLSHSDNVEATGSSSISSCRITSISRAELENVRRLQREVARTTERAEAAE